MTGVRRLWSFSLGSDRSTPRKLYFSLRIERLFMAFIWYCSITSFQSYLVSGSLLGCRRHTCFLSNVWILAYGCHTFYSYLNIFILKSHHKLWLWVYWNSRYMKAGAYFINWLTHCASTYRGLDKDSPLDPMCQAHWGIFRHCLKHWASSVAFPVESNSSRNLLEGSLPRIPPSSDPWKCSSSHLPPFSTWPLTGLACIQQESCQVTLARLSLTPDVSFSNFVPHWPPSAPCFSYRFSESLLYSKMEPSCMLRSLFPIAEVCPHKICFYCFNYCLVWFLFNSSCGFWMIYFGSLLLIFILKCYHKPWFWAYLNFKVCRSLL